MIAIEIREPGGPDVLVPVERPVPVAGAGEVLIKVAAAGVNRPDVMQRRGRYPPPPGASDIPGLEVAGTIEAARSRRARLGGRRPRLRAGRRRRLRRVLRRAGAAVPAGAARASTSCSAAAIPETFFTVWTNVFERGRLQAGESILIHGGSSGIGTTAIQLARAFGARVFATAGSAEKCARLRAARRRARDQLSRRRISSPRSASATGGRGVDVVLDMVGGDYLPRNIDVLAIDGRLVQIAHARRRRRRRSTSCRSCSGG